MNTSSRPGADLRPFVAAVAERRDGRFERGGIVAADVQRGAEGHGLLHAGLAAQLLRELRADPGR